MPDVQIGSQSRLDRCVAMAGAQVGANVQLTECMLFPGARVPDGKVRARTIFTPDAEIRCAPGEA